MEENKREIVETLFELLRNTRAGSDIEKMTYMADSELVLIRRDNGFSQAVNVECDSGIALIRDVLKHI